MSMVLMHVAYRGGKIQRYQNNESEGFNRADQEKALTARVVEDQFGREKLILES